MQFSKFNWIDLMFSGFSIKTSDSESRDQEADRVCIFRPTWQLQWVIYTNGSAKILKWVEPTAEGSIKPANPFVRTSQSASFGTCFHDYDHYSTYTCINT